MICLVRARLLGLMALERSTPMMGTELPTALARAHLPGRLEAELLLPEMPLVLDHALRLTVEETAGDQVPRLLLGECRHQLQEPVATTRGATHLVHLAQATMLLHLEQLSGHQLLVQ